MPYRQGRAASSPLSWAGEMEPPPVHTPGPGGSHLGKRIPQQGLPNDAEAILGRLLPVPMRGGNRVHPGA